MAGILNNKERVMDLLVTREGRRQAASGQLRIHFASFTDCHTFYQASGSFGVAEDATSRIFFEATSRHQDVVVPELEPSDNSMTVSFKGPDFVIEGKEIATGTFRRGVQITQNKIIALSGSKFHSEGIPRVIK